MSRHRLFHFRPSYSNSNNRRSFDKSSSPSGGGGYAAAAAAGSSSERERENDLNRSKAGGGGDKSGQVGPETLKGIYKNEQFMKQLTTLIGCNMRVSRPQI